MDPVQESVHAVKQIVELGSFALVVIINLLGMILLSKWVPRLVRALEALNTKMELFSRDAMSVRNSVEEHSREAGGMAGEIRDDISEFRSEWKGDMMRLESKIDGVARVIVR